MNLIRLATSSDPGRFAFSAFEIKPRSLASRVQDPDCPQAKARADALVDWALEQEGSISGLPEE